MRCTYAASSGSRTRPISAWTWRAASAPVRLSCSVDLSRASGPAVAGSKAQLGAGVRLPPTGRVAIAVADEDAPGVVAVADHLRLLGFEVVAGAPTAAALAGIGYPVAEVAGDLAGVTMALAAGTGAAWLRAAATGRKIPCYTTIAGLAAGARAIQRMREGPLPPRPLEGAES